MASANPFLSASGGSSAQSFSVMAIREDFLSVKSSSAVLVDSSSSSYYLSVLSAQFPSEYQRTVTTNTTTSTGTLEIFNTTSSNGGLLTHVQIQGLSLGAEGTLRITRDGNAVDLALPSVDVDDRIVLGSGFLPYQPSTVNERAAGYGSGLDLGYSAYVMLNLNPPQASALGGLSFDSTCVVEVILTSGTFITSGTDERNMSYCAADTMPRIQN